MKQLIYAATAAAVIASAACSTNKEDNSEPGPTAAETLRVRLDSVVARGLVMFGHDDDPVYGHTWVGDSGRSDVLETAGDYPAMMNWDLGGIENSAEVNLDSVSFERMRTEAIAQDARGGVNAFSWHSVNPVDGQDSWQCNDTTIVAQILTDSVVGARFEQQVQRAARFISSLTDSEGNKIGVVFRPWHEHTGAWFWWGEKQCTPEQYKALWHRTREIFDAEGVDNVLWAYSPDRVVSLEQYMERYPGDEYVDIMGADVYAYGGEKGVEQYNKAVDATLGAATKAAQEHGKLVAFTETGLEGVTMDNWWTDVMLPAIARHPVAYVVVWRNAHDKPGHFFGPWPGHSSAESFRAFYADPRTVFARDMNKIR